MAKLPEKFEDWTPPWAAGEFDEEKAARGIFTRERQIEQLKADKAALTSQVGTLTSDLAAANDKVSTAGTAESAKDTEINQLKGQVRELEALRSEGRPEDRAAIQRLEIAIDHGLTARDARRLVGDSPEELAEDAADLAKRLGIGGSGEQTSSEPPRRQPAVRDLGNGRNRGNEAPQLLTAEELLSKGTVSAANGELNLATIGPR